MVIWIVGLSGSGKTYLAKSLFTSFKGKKIIVDGDIVRKYITYNLKYSKKDRKKNSQIISDLCQFLEAQGFLVICSILSIFTEHQKKNREKFKNYFQIFINSNISNLKKRNVRKVYAKKNVVGNNIRFPKPYKSDLVIENKFTPYSQKRINQIIKKINEIKKNKKNFKKF
jgi:adenylylsulfate kinase-like enzyme